MDKNTIKYLIASSVYAIIMIIVNILMNNKTNSYRKKGAIAPF